ncbi:hypothetical protein [Motilimonas pumila]|uniref:DUF2799 domain-containing protein n=1 Tax=Motilimonas pumila TaxID=2303987 RepID=A0A418YHY6_9GAMM|nr:hypothetical protein [Motilimonas pumila]RJG49955.1 hypothetical protein D1Z90_04740 [Motilimonas pumila]
MRISSILIISSLCLSGTTMASDSCNEAAIKAVAKTDATQGLPRFENLDTATMTCDAVDEQQAKDWYSFSFDLTYSEVCHGEEGYKLGKAGQPGNPICKTYVNAGYYQHRHIQGLEVYKRELAAQAKEESK